MLSDSRYIQEQLGLNQLDPMYRQFAKIFETFRIAEPEAKIESSVTSGQESSAEVVKLVKSLNAAGEEIEDDDDEVNITNIPIIMSLLTIQYTPIYCLGVFQENKL